MQFGAVILAAGKGTRMKSALPKVLHPLAGQPLVLYAVAAARAATGSVPVLVIGHGGEQVRTTVGEQARFALQAQQLGTGHAVRQAADQLSGRADAILVTYADMPLLMAETLKEFIQRHVASRATVTIMTVISDHPRGYGRVLRGAAGRPLAVVEEPDCTAEQLAIRELNAGVYCFAADWLWTNLPDLPLSRKGEYYLTDAVGMAVAQGELVEAVVCADPDELLGINTRVHLAEAERALRGRINRQWMEAGVTLLDPAVTYIDAGVTVGQDTTIFPNSYLLGRTTIGSGCHIGPNSWIKNSQIGDGCTVPMSMLEQVTVAAGAHVDPFSYLKERVHLGPGALIARRNEGPRPNSGRKRKE